MGKTQKYHFTTRQAQTNIYKYLRRFFHQLMKLQYLKARVQHNIRKTTYLTLCVPHSLSLRCRPRIVRNVIPSIYMKHQCFLQHKHTYNVDYTITLTRNMEQYIARGQRTRGWMVKPPYRANEASFLMHELKLVLN